MNNYDLRVITAVTLLSLAVANLLLIVSAPTNLYFMPLGWFVGAMMVWAYGKWSDRNTIKY